MHNESPSGKSPNDFEQLNQILEETDKVINEREQARKKVTNMIRALCLILILFAGYYTFRVYSAVQSLATGPKQKALVAELQTSLEDISPDARKELERISTSVLPVYSKAIQDEMAKSWPEVKNLTRAESETLLINVQANFKKQMEVEINKFLSKYTAQLTAYNPELKDPVKAQEAIQNLATALTEKAVEIFNKKLDPHRKAMSDLYATIDQFPQHEPSPDLDAGLELMALTMEYFNIHSGSITNIPAKL